MLSATVSGILYRNLLILTGAEYRSIDERWGLQSPRTCYQHRNHGQPRGSPESREDHVGASCCRESSTAVCSPHA